MTLPPNDRAHGPRATTVELQTLGSYETKATLFLKSDPMRALFDFPTFLRRKHLLSHPIEFLQHGGLSAHSGHERHDQGTLGAFVESPADFGIERAPAAHATQSHVGFDHADNFELTENLVHAIGGVGPDRAQSHHSDVHALLAQVLNRETRGHRMPALDEEYDIGAVGHELFHPRIVAPAEDLREFVVSLLNDGHGAFHGAGTLQLQRRTLLRHDLRAVRHRMSRVERVGLLVGRQELLDLAWVGQFDVRGDVRNKEAILADHLREEYARVFPDAIAHQMIVERFLGITGPTHQPAHVAGRECVSMLGTEIARWVEGAVGDHHLHRHAAAGDR